VRSLRISAAALAVPLVFVATGCGESSSPNLLKPAGSGAGDVLDPKGPSNEALSAEELSKKAEDSFKDLPNLRLKATGTAFDTPIGADIKIGTGEQAEGRITLKDKGLDIIAVDKSVYVKLAPGTIDLFLDMGKRAEATNSTGKPESAAEKALGDQFTKMFAEAGKLIEGKYVKLGGSEMSKLSGDLVMGGGSPLDGLFGSGSESDSPSFEPGSPSFEPNSPSFEPGSPSFDPDFDNDPPEAPATKGPVTEINGVKVIPLISKDPENNETVTMYVAANGRPLPVRVTGDSGSDGSIEMTMDFTYSKIDQPVTPKAPPASETIDLNALMDSFGDKMTDAFTGGQDKTA
jgi:hypothetical protein